MTDNEIIQKIMEGDRNKYRLLVERYQPVVFRTCMGFLHDKDDADDLSQDIFIQAWQALPTFKGKSAFSTWIYRIAVNAALNKVRKTSGNYLLQRLDRILGAGKQELSGMFRKLFPVACCRSGDRG